ncbi:MAG: DUF1501 domain-containing protein [Thermoguttaceae bacterium]
MNRRDFVKLIGATGLSLAGEAAVVAQVANLADMTKGKGPSDKPSRAVAKSVIQLWMGGGPCHIDTWDPKPNAGQAYRGPYAKAIATNVDGIQISPMLPKMAKQIDKCALLRGMTHGSNAHEIGTYMMQTGTTPSADLVYPSVGAVVAFKRSTSGQYRGALPPYIAVTQPLGRFSEAGFLGSAYKMFATGGKPNSPEFSIGGLNVANQSARIQQRRDLVAAFDGLARSLGDDPQLKQVDEYQQKAYELILGDAKEAFELNKESDKMRDRYGRTTFGQSCLLARRLVEKGVPFVTVNWPGWDTHARHFERMAKMLPELDQGFSALLEDLAQRGLLSTTIVTWFGEFGRTPKIATQPPWNGGRHHYGKAFSAVVAGGGFQGGKVVGETDPRGEKVIKRRIYPWDLSASMYQLLGIDPAGRLPHPHGCVAYVTPPASGNSQPSEGMLKEIM